MEKRGTLPRVCPSCGAGLKVHTMLCGDCKTQIVGEYNLSPLLTLREEEQAFILDFVMCSGSLKEMASRMGLSYPTVRNRLDDIIARLDELEKESTNNK